MNKIEISITPFKAKHLPHLLEILQSRNSPYLQHIDLKTLPKVGYIAFLGKQPIAAGFLRRLEPSLGIIDTLCSNAYFGSNARHTAIDLVVKNLIDDANRLKLTGILAFTVDDGVLSRAKSLGFHILPDTMIALPLKTK